MVEGFSFRSEYISIYQTGANNEEGKTMIKRLIFLIMIFFLIISSAQAEDIDTMIPKTVPVKPNVVLILDNSTTMVNTIEGPKGTFSATINYEGPANPFDSNKYYYDETKTITSLPEKTIPDLQKLKGKAIAEIGQEQHALKEELETKGFATSEGITYYIGNYLNWFYESRFNFAKRSIYKFIENETRNINFSVLTPESYQSPESFAGYVADCGQGQCTRVHIRNINGITCQSALERSLLETSAYFKDEKTIYGKDNRTYSNTIKYSCQPNAVVIISDGLSRWSGSSPLIWPWSQPNEEFADKGVAGDYLDDVAEKLYQTDLRSDLTGMQIVRTFTAGFRSDPKAQAKQDNLKSTAQRGGGEFTELLEVDALEAFLISIRNSLANSTSGGISVPSSSDARSFSGEYAYLSMFKKMTTEERWIGNIKKFRILDNSTLDTIDAWTDNDSDDAGSGGVRQILLETSMDERKIYSNKNASTSLFEFKTENFTSSELTDYNLTESIINNIRCGGSCIEGNPGVYALGDIIHFLPLVNFYKAADGSVETRIFAGGNDGMVHCFDDKTGKEKWAYIPDDQLKRLKLLTPAGHPETVTVSYHSSFVDGGRTIYDNTAGQKLLIFGERRGGKNYYAMNVSNADTPSLAYRVKLDDDNSFGQSWTNPKVVPVMYGNSLKNVFWIGGGYDEANQEQENGPSPEDTLGKGVYSIDAESGQKLDIISGTSFSSIKNCILDPVSFNPGFTGGDAEHPANSAQVNANSRLYACDMGANLWGFRDDEIPENTVLVRGPGTKDGSWVMRKIFSGGTAPQRKVFSSPEIVMESFTQTITDETGKITGYVTHKGEYIYFGTGDREDPTYLPAVNEETTRQDRFYAIKNYWLNGDDTSVTENNLIDVSADSIQMQDDQTQKATLLSFENKGWYIRLENPGEKVVSSPLAYNGMLFFTTYTPSEDDNTPGRRGNRHRYRHRYRYEEQNGNGGGGGGNGNGGRNSNANQNGNGGNGNGNGQGNDPCEGADDAGTARLYCLNYKTGEAVLDLDSTSSVERLRKDSNGNFLDANGNITDQSNAQKLTGLHKNDRNTEIGSGIPGEPQLFFPKTGGTQIIVGVNNNMKAFTLPVHDMHVFYWREK